MSAEELHHSSHGDTLRPLDQVFEEPEYDATTAVLEASEEGLEQLPVEVNYSPAQQRYAEVAIINSSTGLFQEVDSIPPEYFDSVSGSEMLEDIHRYSELDDDLRIATEEYKEFTVLQNTINDIIPVISGEKQVAPEYAKVLGLIKDAITIEFPRTVHDQHDADEFWGVLGELTYYKGSLPAIMDMEGEYLEQTLALAQSTRERIADITVRQQIEEFSALLREHETEINRQVAITQQAVDTFKARFDPKNNIED